MFKQVSFIIGILTLYIYSKDSINSRKGYSPRVVHYTCKPEHSFLFWSHRSLHVSPFRELFARLHYNDSIVSKLKCLCVLVVFLRTPNTFGTVVYTISLNKGYFIFVGIWKVLVFLAFPSICTQLPISINFIKLLIVQCWLSMNKTFWHTSENFLFTCLSFLKVYLAEISYFRSHGRF